MHVGASSRQRPLHCWLYQCTHDVVQRQSTHDAVQHYAVVGRNGSCPSRVLPQYFNAPIKTAAQAVGLSLSCFKKVCRRLGVPRWPARKLRCLGKLRDTVLQQDDLPADVKEVGYTPALAQLVLDRFSCRCPTRLGTTMAGLRLSLLLSPEHIGPRAYR